MKCFSFDSSRSTGRSEFNTKIGVGRVIKGMSDLVSTRALFGLSLTPSNVGWDQGVVDMTLGEKATLIIPRYVKQPIAADGSLR
jgi:FKBP-type peptidyl-prolyl cis-trans isomerase